MLLISLIFLFFLFPSPIFSAPIIEIVSTTNPIVQFDSFTINLTLTNLTIGETYYLKAFNDGSDENLIKTVSSGKTLPYTGHSWSEYPSLIADNSNLSSTLLAIAYNNPTLSVKVRMAKKNGDNYDTYNSNVLSLAVITPTPSPTLIPTPTPTNTPIPTPSNTPIPSNTLTPTPTKTPTPTHTSSPTSTPKPTATITPVLTIKPTPTEDPTDLPTPSPSPTDSEILGIQDFVASPAAVSTKTKLPKNLIPSIFIGTGTALLLTPLILSKLKHGQN